jgi:hypothetical protein
MGACNCKVLQGDSHFIDIDQTRVNSETINDMNNKVVQKEVEYKTQNSHSKAYIGTQPHQGMNSKRLKKYNSLI